MAARVDAKTPEDPCGGGLGQEDFWAEALAPKLLTEPPLSRVNRMPKGEEK